MNVGQRPPVLVGVDGSADAAAAAEYGAREAGRRHLPLHLVHALQLPAVYGATMMTAYDPTALIRDVQVSLGGIADGLRLRHPGLEVTTAVTVSDPAGVLVEESRTAALVVVGSRGLGRFERLLAGSVSAQVATHAHAPVVVLRPPATNQQPPTAAGVVVGVDGSVGSAAAVAFAFEEAATLGTDLIAVYVWAALPTGNLGPISESYYDPAVAQQEADRMLAEALAGWQEKFPDVTVVRHAVHSLNPLATLIEEGADAHLIVVGPRGRGGFTGLLLGSVSDGLVRHASRPVAVVHTHPHTS